jgi:hypothetical protein
MKRKTLAVILAMCVIFATTSACLASYTRSTNKTSKISKDNYLNINTDTDGNEKKSHQNTGIDVSSGQNNNIDDAPATNNLQGETSNELAEDSVETSNDENFQQELPLPLPDGRIFLNSGPPYAYTPTCTPKEPPITPILPPELEN